MVSEGVLVVINLRLKSDHTPAYRTRTQIKLYLFFPNQNGHKKSIKFSTYFLLHRDSEFKKSRVTSGWTADLTNDHKRSALRGSQNIMPSHKILLCILSFLSLILSLGALEEFFLGCFLGMLGVIEERGKTSSSRFLNLRGLAEEILALSFGISCIHDGPQANTLLIGLIPDNTLQAIALFVKAETGRLGLHSRAYTYLRS